MRRINDQFVPVALKAALVNNPPAGMEGAFLAEISRLLDNNGVRDRIVNASTEDEIIGILTE